jgi:hypothetical protein
MVARVHGLSASAICQIELRKIFQGAMKKIGLSILPVLLVAFGAAIPAAPAAQASVVTFDVQGQGIYAGDNSTQSFSGTLGVDTTTGSVAALDIQIPFFSKFTTAGLSLGVSLPESFSFPDYVVNSENFTVIPNPIVGPRLEGATIYLQFTTTTPGSLVGFSGGTIDGGSVGTPGGFGYSNFSGTISATPLPPTWTMMLIGLAGFGFAAYRRKSKPALIAA